jgi:hypothetical protein
VAFRLEVRPAQLDPPSLGRRDGGTEGGTAPQNRLSKPNATGINEPAKPFTPVRFR